MLPRKDVTNRKAEEASEEKRSRLHIDACRGLYCVCVWSAGSGDCSLARDQLFVAILVSDLTKLVICSFGPGFIPLILQIATSVHIEREREREKERERKRECPPHPSWLKRSYVKCYLDPHESSVAPHLNYLENCGFSTYSEIQERRHIHAIQP
ncbi:hypothetical protein KP509_22G004500 [Ceratopteris richardii]|uniref:Uncharacterized protein n=1 Tax=Ceratopteris richardii TaxID=49495 RepID=A0A8T2S4C7_CERRI|nr:hypothetical protein KP509_22G004500 [Ceratopteris richardii]KAH7306273.1 hypothetical protein KP509_22G004500 [Ceratopteris richardii]